MGFETTLELATYVEQEIGHRLPSGQASTQRPDIISHLNWANRIVHNGGGILNYSDDGSRTREDVVFAFALAQNPKVFNLVAPITTLTGTITKGSSTLTLSSTVATDLDDYFFKFSGDNETYRVQAHTGGSASITLDAAYVGDDKSVAALDVFKLLYTVGSGDVLRLVGPIYPYGANRERDFITLTDRNELFEKCPVVSIGKAFPVMAAIMAESAGTFTIRFNDYAEDVERLEIDFLPIPAALVSGSVNPTMPGDYRLVLAHTAAYFIMRRNRNDVAQGHLRDARYLFAQLVEWNEKHFTSGDPNYGRIITPRGRVHGMRRRQLVVQRGYGVA